MITSNRYSILLVMILLLAATRSFAQKEICGFDEIYKQSLKNPETAKSIELVNERIRSTERSLNFLKSMGISPDIINPGSSNPLYQIPVVVHIVHRGTATDPLGSVNNPTDAQVANMITFLNSVYAGTNVTGGTSTPIRFILAQRNPSCQATTGVVRYDASAITNYTTNGVGAAGFSDEDLKALSRWPSSNYYNIWIVSKIYNSNPSLITQGYAYFPGAPEPVDGTVIIGSVANASSLTLAHEMGHAFGLYHTFEGSTETSAPGSCPTNNNCNDDGDRVCDTAPHRYAFGCPASTDPNDCVAGQNFLALPTNIMSYFSCRNKFTTGQGSRALSTLLAEKSGLIYSMGGTAATASNTLPAAIPASSTVVNDLNTNIGPIKINLNTIQYASSGYGKTDAPNAGGYAYTDNTCNFRTDLSRNQSYTLEVTTINNPQRVKAWIDFNNNSIFETSELILTGFDNTTGTHTYTAIIPTSKLSEATTVLNMPLRMRVGADYAGSPDFTYNTQLQYGQMEDFTIIVNNSTPLSVAFGNIDAIINNNELQVDWTSLSEENNDHYDIELSVDGKNFYKVGEQKSTAENGNSTEKITYSFKKVIDTSKLAASFILGSLVILSCLTTIRRRRTQLTLLFIGISIVFAFNSCNKNTVDIDDPNVEANVFIRIAQVDKDGTTTYSKVVKVKQ